MFSAKGESHAILHVNDLASVKYSKNILRVQRTMVEPKSAFKDLNCDGGPFDSHVSTLIEQIIMWFVLEN